MRTWTRWGLAPRRRVASSTTIRRQADLLRWLPEAPAKRSLGGQRELFAELGSWEGLANGWMPWSGFKTARWAWRAVLLRTSSLSSASAMTNILCCARVWLRPFGSPHQRRPHAMVANGELRSDTDVDWSPHPLGQPPRRPHTDQARRDPQALRRALDGAHALIGTYRPSAHPDTSITFPGWSIQSLLSSRDERR